MSRSAISKSLALSAREPGQVIFRYLKQMEKRETERVLLAEVDKTKPRRALGFKVGKGKR